MKEAVHRLRNQLRRKTKKPSTISVLKAAKQEIDVSQHRINFFKLLIYNITILKMYIFRPSISHFYSQIFMQCYSSLSLPVSSFISFHAAKKKTSFPACQ